jgi:hypothetical protein
MEMTTLPKYWYSTISVLPDPEAGERVVSALIVGTERWARLDYLENLPKLACLLPASDLRFFRDVLGWMQGRVQRPEDFFSLGLSLGSHFAISEPRALV